MFSGLRVASARLPSMILKWIFQSSTSTEFSYVWDNRDRKGVPVASGLYFARLQVGQDVVVRKFVVLR